MVGTLNSQSPDLVPELARPGTLIEHARAPADLIVPPCRIWGRCEAVRDARRAASPDHEPSHPAGAALGHHLDLGELTRAN